MSFLRVDYPMTHLDHHTLIFNVLMAITLASSFHEKMTLINLGKKGPHNQKLQ